MAEDSSAATPVPTDTAAGDAGTPPQERGRSLCPASCFDCGDVSRCFLLCSTCMGKKQTNSHALDSLYPPGMGLTDLDIGSHSVPTDPYPGDACTATVVVSPLSPRPLRIPPVFDLSAPEEALSPLAESLPNPEVLHSTQVLGLLACVSETIVCRGRDGTIIFDCKHAYRYDTVPQWILRRQCKPVRRVLAPGYVWAHNIIECKSVYRCEVHGTHKEFTYSICKETNCGNVVDNHGYCWNHASNRTHCFVTTCEEEPMIGSKLCIFHSES
jgi:hypothetical protein